LTSIAVLGNIQRDGQVVEYAKIIYPSGWGEWELISLNRIPLAHEDKDGKVFGRVIPWLDPGAHEALMHAAKFVQAMDVRRGSAIFRIEEIPCRRKSIGRDQGRKTAQGLANRASGAYLVGLIEKSDWCP